MIDTPPQDNDAEQSVLGSCMLSKSALAECRNLVSDDDFYRPSHHDIWQAICAVDDAREPVDIITVAQQMTERGQLVRIGGIAYLHTLTSGTPTAANAGYYAKIVSEKAILRQLIQASTSIAQRAYEADRGNFPGSIAEVVDFAEIEMGLATKLAAIGKLPDGLSTWADFITNHAGEQREWVIPGALAQQDVVMVLAPPGAGKTTLSRQLCWCVSAGMNPFNPVERFQPQVTLLVDLEVDPSTAADESTAPIGQIKRMSGHDDVDSQAWIWSHVEGVDLRKPAEARVFEQVIAEVKPTLVAFGSLYKAGIQARGGESHEVAANEVREVFDRLRRRYNFALWIEHHMPKAQDGGRKKNPFGSSVWEWWPSHGRVLERTVEGSAGSPFGFSPTFRGDRGQRSLPAGFSRSGQLPWNALDEGDLKLLTEAAEVEMEQHR